MRRRQFRLVCVLLVNLITFLIRAKQLLRTVYQRGLSVGKWHRESRILVDLANNLSGKNDDRSV